MPATTILLLVSILIDFPSQFEYEPKLDELITIYPLGVPKDVSKIPVELYLVIKILFVMVAKVPVT